MINFKPYLTQLSEAFNILPTSVEDIMVLPIKNTKEI
jgi:hypothetical protein